MANEMFHHYDRPRIAMLCEKAGLAARALEHYDNVEDMKRAMMRTELIPPEFLVKFFGTLSVENAIECLNHLLRTNMRQNLQTVIQVAREYSEQLGPDKLIEMFPSPRCRRRQTLTQTRLLRLICRSSVGHPTP